jgi:hypothetical protein
LAQFGWDSAVFSVCTTTPTSWIESYAVWKSASTVSGLEVGRIRDPARQVDALHDERTLVGIPQHRQRLPMVVGALRPLKRALVEWVSGIASYSRLGLEHVPQGAEIVILHIRAWRDRWA